MPELPEIYVLAHQMDEALNGKTITGIEVDPTQEPEYSGR